MLKHITFIVMLATILMSANVVRAGEFNCQPPIFVETRGKTNFSKAMLDMQIAEIMMLEGRKNNYVKPQTTENVPQNTEPEPELKGPLFYMSAGMKSEDRWFDRRLNWLNYDVNMNFEYKFVGLSLKGACSDIDRDEFEIFNSHATLYFFTGDRTSSQSATGFRVGGGISYFYSDPLYGQTFLENRRGAAFIDLYFEGWEMKFVGLYDEDDFWGGGLFEVKYVNPFFMKGLSATSAAGAFLNPLSALMLVMMFIVPSEYGITGAYGLPDNSDGWGWFMRWRYPFVFTYERLPSAIIKPGFYWGMEFYWGYQGGFANDNSVSEGWEIGLRLFVFAF